MRRVRSLVRADELEGRARVVVEAAHERRRDDVRHAQRVEVPLDGVEVLAARVAERLADLRSVGERRLHRGALDVEDLERARIALVPRVLVEHLRTRVEPRVQPFHVRGPAVLVPDRVEPQLPLGHADAAQELRVELDDLRVDRGIGRAERLDRPLPVLAVAAAARSAVPVHRGDRVRLDGLRLAVEAMLHVCPRDRRRPLGPERQRAVAPVGEGVHLLVDHVRAFAGRAREERRILEAGRLDPPPAVEGRQVFHLADEPPPRVVRRQDVVRPARRLERGHEARSSARNGLPASSAPSVVGGPWPGNTSVSGG